MAVQNTCTNYLLLRRRRVSLRIGRGYYHIILRSRIGTPDSTLLYTRRIGIPDKR